MVCAPSRCLRCFSTMRGFPGFSGGFIGVDVFFVISGYLITGLIADDLRNARFSLATFYFRRIRRILPALLCMYLVCTLLAAAFMLPGDMAEFAGSLRSSATFTSNYFFYRLADYFGGQSDLKPLLHTWSLSIEEQFYVVWPLALMAMARWQPRYLPIAAWAVGGISFAAAAIMVGHQKEAAFFSPPSEPGSLCWVRRLRSRRDVRHCLRGSPSGSLAPAWQ